MDIHEADASQLAPSMTAQTCSAWTILHRRVSTSARSIKRSAQVMREKEDRSLARLSDFFLDGHAALI